MVNQRPIDASQARSSDDLKTSSPEFMPEFTPASVAELVDHIRRFSDTVLLPVGSNTKSAMTRIPEKTVTRIHMRSIEGVIDYQPADFTITVAAGTKVETVDKCLRECGQFLPFDPPFASKGSTIGGMVAAGLNGPCRMLWGGLRDFLLAVEFIDGLGKLVRGGARVVKNSAGFDLPKFMAGSMGRYGIMTSITFKVFPSPVLYRTWRVGASTLAQAMSCLEKISRLPLDLVAVELDRCGMIHMRGVGSDRVLDATQARLREVLSREIESVSGVDEAPFWCDRRDNPLSYFSKLKEGASDRDSIGSSLIKLSLSPSNLVSLDRWLDERGVCRTYGHAGNSAWIAWPQDRHRLELHQQVLAMGMTAVVVDGDLQPGWMIGKQEQSFLDRIRNALDPLGRWLQ